MNQVKMLFSKYFPEYIFKDDLFKESWDKHSSRLSYYDIETMISIDIYSSVYWYKGDLDRHEHIIILKNGKKILDKVY